MFSRTSTVAFKPHRLSCLRAVRSGRRYKGARTSTSHTTYFQPPPPERPQRRWRFLRGFLIASTAFIGGAVVHSWATDIVDALDEEELEEEGLTAEAFKNFDVKGAQYAIAMGKSLTVPTLSASKATELLELNAGIASSPCTITHQCTMASNLPSEDACDSGSFQHWCFWGIYDGHAGPTLSNTISHNLPNVVAGKLINGGWLNRPYIANDQVIISTIKEAFRNLDAFISSIPVNLMRDETQPKAEVVSALARVTSGSCALMALFDEKNSVLRVANTGDSRAVLGRWDAASGRYVALPMSEDHTGFNKSEVQRLKDEHPGEDVIDPSTGRLFGLAVTRAFGDARWKWPVDDYKKAHEEYWAHPPRPNGVIKTPPYLTAEPEVKEVRVQMTGRPDFLIMASDGLWDHLSSQDAVTLVQLWLDKYDPILTLKDLPKPSELLAEMEAREPKQFVGDKDADTFYDPVEKTMKWRIDKEHFVVEDNNCGIHLVKNAFGGNRRDLFSAVMSLAAPLSRNVRDDVTVDVIFFGRGQAELAKFIPQTIQHTEA